MSGFGDDIAAWASESQEWILEEAAVSTRKLFSDVISFSPSQPSARWSTGRFLANWHIGNTSPNFSLNTEATKSQKIAEINKTITADFFLLHKTAYIVNNLSYSREIEYDGWQRTGPYAPVARAISMNIKGA